MKRKPKRRKRNGSAAGNRPAASRQPGCFARCGITLFEVIVALAIFVGSIAAIGQLISSGVRGAVLARLQTQAIIRAESKLAEVAAGVTPLRSASNVAFPDDATWMWSMTVAPGPHASLYLVEVTVTHPSSTSAGTIVYPLRRFVRDPQLEMAAYEKQLEQQQATSNTNSSNSSSSNSRSGSSSSSGSSK